MSYKGGTSICEKYMYDPHKAKKPRATNSSRVKKSKREVRDPAAESFKAYHPYNVHVQPSASSHSSSPQRAQLIDPLSFSPQTPAMALPSVPPPPPRVRPLSTPTPAHGQHKPAPSPLQHLLHAIEGYQETAAYTRERQHSPGGVSRSSSYGFPSSQFGRSRSSSPASTPPLTPHSASSRLSACSSSRSSSRHTTPEMDYYAPYADPKPVKYDYDQYLGTYHASVGQNLYGRRH
ncbi:unnamed protein product [Peniophora sp. CBMAI 1063]|nr:unnamed protein product [Peniophora sp. CBMAI 1063]